MMALGLLTSLPFNPPDPISDLENKLGGYQQYDDWFIPTSSLIGNKKLDPNKSLFESRQGFCIGGFQTLPVPILTSFSTKPEEPMFSADEDFVDFVLESTNTTQKRSSFSLYPLHNKTNNLNGVISYNGLLTDKITLNGQDNMKYSNIELEE
jgi:hypothetical protein